MIDTYKYEGHTPAPWGMAIGHIQPDARLITDAPLLLAEVKRLREGIEQAVKLLNTDANATRELLKELIE